MVEMQIPNASEVDVSAFAPPTAAAIKLKLTISPPSGAVLVYSPKTVDPVLFRGPHDTKDVPLSGPKIYIQLVQGATEYDVEALGWTDGHVT